MSRLSDLEARIGELERRLATHEHMAVGASIFPGRRRPHWVEPDGSMVGMDLAEESDA